MKVKQSVLDKLGTNHGLALIMTTLDCSHSTARNLVKGHKADDDLTKVSMLSAIKDKFNLSDAEILEEGSEVEAQK